MKVWFYGNSVKLRQSPTPAMASMHTSLCWRCLFVSHCCCYFYKYCSAQLSMFTMEKSYRNKITIITMPISKRQIKLAISKRQIKLSIKGSHTHTHTHPLTRSAVSVLMVLAPQFWIRVLGMTSRAREMARYGHWWTPVMDLAFSFSACTQHRTLWSPNNSLTIQHSNSHNTWLPYSEPEQKYNTAVADLPTQKYFCPYSEQPMSVFSDFWPDFLRMHHQSVKTK